MILKKQYFAPKKSMLTKKIHGWLKTYNLKDLLFFIVIQFEKHIYRKWKKNKIFWPKRAKVGSQIFVWAEASIGSLTETHLPFNCFCAEKKSISNDAVLGRSWQKKITQVSSRTRAGLRATGLEPRVVYASASRITLPGSFRLSRQPPKDLDSATQAQALSLSLSRS